MKKLMKKFYEEEISREEFINAASKEVNDKKFISWLADCIEFGSIEDDFNAAKKEYIRNCEIENVAHFLATGQRKEKKQYNRSEIMKRAWQIAREAVVKFAGKVRAYFSESLKMAWAEAKA